MTEKESRRFNAPQDTDPRSVAPQDFMHKPPQRLDWAEEVEAEGIKELRNEFTEWHSGETTFAYGVPNDKTIADWWIEKIHQELQKARHDWLREEIVKLEGEKLGGLARPIFVGANAPERMRIHNRALQTIIDRYQSELDQLTK